MTQGFDFLLIVHQLSRTQQMKLRAFIRARAKHEPAMNNIQLRAIYGKPVDVVSHCNVKGLKKSFLEVHYQCGGMHKKYEW